MGSKRAEYGKQEVMTPSLSPPLDERQVQHSDQINLNHQSRSDQLGLIQIKLNHEKEEIETLTHFKIPF